MSIIIGLVVVIAALVAWIIIRERQLGRTTKEQITANLREHAQELVATIRRELQRSASDGALVVAAPSAPSPSPATSVQSAADAAGAAAAAQAAAAVHAAAVQAAAAAALQAAYDAQRASGTPNALDPKKPADADTSDAAYAYWVPSAWGPANGAPGWVVARWAKEHGG